MRNRHGLLRRTLAVSLMSGFALIEASAQTVLFSDTFDSEDLFVFTNAVNQTVPVGSTPWTYQGQEALQNRTDYGVDYAAAGIPEAPNTQSGDALGRGVALRANVTQGRRDQAAIFVEDPSFTGRYRVQVDMYLSWAAEPSGQVGTTEHGGLFIGKDTPSNPALTDDNALDGDRAYPGSAGAGALFASDGGALNFDYLLLKNNVYPTTTSEQYSVSDFGFGSQLGYDNTDVNEDPANGELINLPELFPELVTPTGITQAAGAIGFRWVTLIADVDTDAIGNGTGTTPGLATFSVEVPESGESFTLGTLDNSIIDDPGDGPLLGFEDETEQGPVDMSGRVTLTLVDFFPSVASDQSLAQVYFDNLIVTQVEATLEGDYNGDGFVDAADYTIFRDTLGDSVTAGTGADGNGNGVIDGPGSGSGNDYEVWANNYGAVASPAASAVPEPSTIVSVVVAICSLAARRCRS